MENVSGISGGGKVKDEPIKELEELYTLRTQLIKARKILSTSETGREHQVMRSICVHRHVQGAIDKLSLEIAAVESEIEKIILDNQEMKENYEQVKGITGIGPVIATDLLIKTGLPDDRYAPKSSFYAGVCPFPNSTGKMVGKAKTSPFADKKLKSLFIYGC
jgi:transposase